MIETKVVRVAGHLTMSNRGSRKTASEMEHVINEMAAQGWTLVHNSAIGGGGGNLTFQRER